MSAPPFRSIPALPRVLRGAPVARWTRWDPEIVVTHFDPGCDTCGDEGPGCIAMGYAHVLQGGRPAEEHRWHAHRCRACDEMHIYELRHDPRTDDDTSVEVAYYPPRTHKEAPR